jgi:hypothetical protein
MTPSCIYVHIEFGSFISLSTITRLSRFNPPHHVSTSGTHGERVETKKGELLLDER